MFNNLRVVAASRPFRSRAVANSLLFLVAALCASPILQGQVYIDTGHTGAQTQIDVNHTSVWVVTPNSAATLNGAYLTMKDGSATTASVTLSVYSPGNVLVTSVTQTHTQ